MTKRALRADPASMALAVLLVATSFLRVTVGTDKPLWLDEAWTGVMVTQPSLGEFVRQSTYDVNGPLYSVLAALWARIGGISDHGLRAFPMFLGLAAPLIALAPRRLIDKSTRYVWCALLACWIPGIHYSQEARPYTLALMLAVANGVAFASVLRSPTLPAAWVWTAVSALLVLAHYYGLVLVGIQGLTYLVVHKQRALRTWSADLALLLPLATIAFQARSLLRFATPQSSWIGPPDLWSLPIDLSFVVGFQLLLCLTVIWLAAVILVWLRAKGSVERHADRPEGNLWCVPACSVAAVVVAIVLGFLRPMFIERYLIEFVPGVLFGLAMFATRLARRWQLAGATLIAMFASCDVLWAANFQRAAENAFNWEGASHALMAAHPSRLVFLWDTPLHPRPSSRAELGGFFFARAGRPIPVDGLDIPDQHDPNVLLIEHAAPPGSAILWVYDLKVRGTAAIRFPPVIEKLDPRWRCRNFGRGRFGIVACARDNAFGLLASRSPN